MMRCMRPCPTMACVVVILVLGAGAALADKLTDANMTKSDFDSITNTESSIPGQRETEPPLEVHDLSSAGEQAVKEANGTKLIKGKEWKKMSPKERDERLRDIKKVLAGTNLLFIEVPSGNVWSLDRETYYKLKRDRSIKRWDYDEIDKLPKAVKRDPTSTQSDRHGTTLERVLDVEKEEP